MLVQTSEFADSLGCIVHRRENSALPSEMHVKTPESSGLWERQSSRKFPPYRNLPRILRELSDCTG